MSEEILATIEEVEELEAEVEIGGAGIQSVSAGTNVLVNNTDPLNPKVSVVDDPVFAGPISAENLSGTNTGDQDLSPYFKLDQTTPQNVSGGIPNFAGIKTTKIQLNTTYTPTTESVGTMYWDETQETPSIQLKNGVTGQLFEEQFVRIQNNTGAQIPNGKVVTYAGSVGASGKIRGNMTVASAIEKPQYTIGVATEDIADGSTGKVTILGEVRGIQTNGANYGETWVAGDILYKSSTNAGGMTNVRPVAPIPVIVIGTVVSSNPANGTIIVRPTFPGAISQAADVYLSSLQNKDTLLWNSTAGRFENGQFITKVTSAPATPTEGTIYYNTTDKHFYGWNGTTWKQLDN